MKSWTKIEIEDLRRMEHLIEEYESFHEDEKPDMIEQKILFLEAKLLIANKDVVGYIKGKSIGIFSMLEAGRKEMYYISLGKLFIYHPVNFKNLTDFTRFLGIIQ